MIPKPTNSFEYIDFKTGFAFGEEFTSEQQIKDYFTLKNLQDMFGPTDDIGQDLPTQSTLDHWASLVIKNRWHCNF